MPFYEYQCPKCGHRFEIMLTVSERETREKSLACPQCGKTAPRRLISTFATSSASPSAPARPSPGSCDHRG